MRTAQASVCRPVRSGGPLLAGLVLAAGCAGLPSTPPAPRVASLRALAAEGERWWSHSPDPGNPVACATCHHDPAATRGWAASFPKVKPLPPPHRRVMTLLQANAEAVARHYLLADPLPAATAITAYLTAQGEGVPISPGVSAGQPVFPGRMRALAQSVARGERAYARRCGPCHDAARMAPAVTHFPRVVAGRPESLETFLVDHRPLDRRLRWDAPAMADLIAYLVSQVPGRPIRAAADGPGPAGRP
jgi:cytochrome c553